MTMAKVEERSTLAETLVGDMARARRRYDERMAIAAERVQRLGLDHRETRRARDRATEAYNVWELTRSSARLIATCSGVRWSEIGL